jgi:hypothetical protein
MSCYSRPASGGRTGKPALIALDQPQAPATAERCLRLVAGADGDTQCPGEMLGDTELCLRHLREAADWWASMVAYAVDRFPAFGQLLADDQSEEETGLRPIDGNGFVPDEDSRTPREPLASPSRRPS